MFLQVFNTTHHVDYKCEHANELYCLPYLPTVTVTDMDQSTPLSEGSNTLPNAAYYGLGTGLLFLIVVFLGAVIIILAIVLKMRRYSLHYMIIII